MFVWTYECFSVENRQAKLCAVFSGCMHVLEKVCVCVRAEISEVIYEAFLSFKGLISHTLLQYN